MPLSQLCFCRFSESRLRKIAEAKWRSTQHCFLRLLTKSPERFALITFVFSLFFGRSRTAPRLIDDESGKHGSARDRLKRCPVTSRDYSTGPVRESGGFDQRSGRHSCIMQSAIPQVS